MKVRGYGVHRVTAVARGMVMAGVVLVWMLALGIAGDGAWAGQDSAQPSGAAMPPVLIATGDTVAPAPPVTPVAPVTPVTPVTGPTASSSPRPVLYIGFSTSSQPYVDVAGKAGLEPTLVTAALGYSGFQVAPVFLPHARALEQVRKGILDGCGPVGRHADVTGLFLGNMYAQYRNVAVSLEAAGLDIRSLADLRNLPVTAFHNARVFMGPEFAAMADANPRYEEQVDQRAQVDAFFQRRDRVIVLDERIFAFHRARLAARGLAVPVRIHRIFGPQDRFFVFRDPTVRDAFDAGLRVLQENGDYTRLMRSSGALREPGS